MTSAVTTTSALRMVFPLDVDGGGGEKLAACIGTLIPGRVPVLSRIRASHIPLQKLDDRLASAELRRHAQWSRHVPWP